MNSFICASNHYTTVDIEKRSSEKDILEYTAGSLDLTESRGTTSNSPINSIDVSKAKSAFAITDSLSSPVSYTPNSILSMADLKTCRSDEKKYDIPIFISPWRYFMLQSTTSSSEHVPSSYHYRISTTNTASKGPQHIPQYMATTISFAMKMKQMMKRCTPLGSSWWTSRRRHSISEGLRTAVSLTPSRNRKSHRSKLRLWQRATSQPSPKICNKKRSISSPELTAECNTANESNRQNLQQLSPQLLSRVASLPCNGLYHKYLKPLFWDRVISRYDATSQKERFMREGQAVHSVMNAQNEPTETSLNLEQAESQLSLRNSYQEETSRFHLGRDHMQQSDQIHNNAPISSLCTTQVKTPCGWQRTFSRVPHKISRLERFASQFVKAVSAQVWIIESSQRISTLGQSSYFMSSESSKYNIWQWISPNSPQKVSRFKRFWKPEIKDAERASQPSRLGQVTDQSTLTEIGISPEVILERTISKSLSEVSRLNHFPVSEDSISKISQGSCRPEQFELEVSRDFLATQALAPSSPAILPTRLHKGLFYEQAKSVYLPKLSSKSSLSSVHVAHLRSSKELLTESLSFGALPRKHRSNFTIKLLRRASSTEYFQKNALSGSCTTEIQPSEASVLPDVVSHSESPRKRSKSILQRVSRFERFLKTNLSGTSTASTKSCEALTVSNALFSRVSMRRKSKIPKLLRTSRFDRFQKNAVRARSSLALLYRDTSFFDRSFTGRSKPTPSSKCTRQSLFLPSRYLTSSPCVWNKSTAEPMQKKSRIERFQNFASLDVCIARTQPSSSSSFSNISLIPSSGGSLWMQTKTIPPKKISGFHCCSFDFQESDSWQKKVMKIMNRNSRFKRFEDNISPNIHTAQFNLSQNSSAKRFLKKQTKQKIPHKISYKERFKTYRVSPELMIQVNGARYCPYDDRSLCSESPAYSLLTAQQWSPEQSLTCTLNSTDSVKDVLTESTARTIDSDRNQQLEQRISYEEQFENYISAGLNVFDAISFKEIREGISRESWDSAIIQQTQPISHSDQTRKQCFDGE
ncbi:hypothetical protein LOAG_04292 [Loa loa]|uniref:Uncharacterized protein n=1 Tax=Loa loa TaxID=7209 RepID=A0A1S0U384_LOALO|nr:hypothetical protein LOAG_04292 [Loa loa]EFO24193.2 hypothetical protein LOAG_04292 [Loa loa]